jgi:hypothetical protein
MYFAFKCNVYRYSLHNRFAGHPAPAHWPLYLGHAHTLEYLKSYAARFGWATQVRAVNITHILIA